MTDTNRSTGGLGWGFVIVVWFMFGVWGFREYRNGAAGRASEAASERRNDAIAEYRLGVDYDFGRGVPQDYAQAVKHMRKAAEQGDSNAYGFLGSLYGSGEGVPQDYAEAYFWLDLAAASPTAVNTDAILRDQAASHLTNSVLLATQERARKWLEAHPSN